VFFTFTPGSSDVNSYDLKCSVFRALIRSKNIKNKQNSLRYLWCILFTKFSPTCFGRHSDLLHGNVLSTRIRLWWTVSPSLHNNHHSV